MLYVYFGLGSLFASLLVIWATTRYISNNQVGIVEKLWSKQGSLSDGQIVALHGEAGFQPDLLRGGFTLAIGVGSTPCIVNA